MVVAVYLVLDLFNFLGELDNEKVLLGEIILVNISYGEGRLI